MPSQKEIDDAFRRMSGTEKFLGRREIKELPQILWEDELPELAIQGLYNNMSGLLVATNKRLIFVDKGVFSLTVEDFPYDKVTSLQYNTGLAFGGLEIYASGNKAEIKQVSKNQIKPFAEYVRARITKATPHASYTQPVTPASNSNDDMISQLERLAKLKEQSILTEDEFQAQKRKILG